MYKYVQVCIIFVRAYLCVQHGGEVYVVHEDFHTEFHNFRTQIYCFNLAAASIVRWGPAAPVERAAWCSDRKTITSELIHSSWNLLDRPVTVTVSPSLTVNSGHWVTRVTPAVAWPGPCCCSMAAGQRGVTGGRKPLSLSVRRPPWRAVELTEMGRGPLPDHWIQVTRDIQSHAGPWHLPRHCSCPYTRAVAASGSCSSRGSSAWAPAGGSSAWAPAARRLAEQRPQALADTWWLSLDSATSKLVSEPDLQFRWSSESRLSSSYSIFLLTWSDCPLAKLNVNGL